MNLGDLMRNWKGKGKLRGRERTFWMGKNELRINKKKAAGRLAAEPSSQNGVKSAGNVVALHNLWPGSQFCPSISSIHSLAFKWDKVGIGSGNGKNRME
jgi:hypothetical protein